VTFEERGRFVDMLNSIVAHIESPEKIHQNMVDLAVRPHYPHEAIRANRFISQLLDYADKTAKGVCQQLAQRAVT